MGDIRTALAVAASLIATAFGCSNGGDSHDAQEKRLPRARIFRDIAIDLRARIPAGWHVLDSGVVGTRLAATSFPVNGGGLQAACSPQPILRQMPSDGVLIDIGETSPLPLSRAQFLRAFPPRPPAFHLPRRPGRYACGVTYNIFFRDSGRGMHVRVWVRPRTFSDERRAEIVRLLDSLQIGPLLSPRRRTTKRLREAVIRGAKLDFRDSVVMHKRFERCLLSDLRKRLTDRRLEDLRREYFSHGQARVARTLNGVAVPPADRCGRREWVPKLVEASKGVSGYRAG